MPGKHRRRGNASSDSDAAARPAKRPRAARGKKPKALAPLEPFDAARELFRSSAMNRYSHMNRTSADWRRHVVYAVKRAGACASALGAMPKRCGDLHEFCGVIYARIHQTTGLQRVHVQQLVPCACSGECRWRLCADPPKAAHALVRAGAGPSAADLPLHLLARVVRAVGPRRGTLEALTQTAQALRAAVLGELPQMFIDYDIGPYQIDHPLVPALRCDDQVQQLPKHITAQLLERPLTCLRTFKNETSIHWTKTYYKVPRPMYREVPRSWGRLLHGAASPLTLAMIGRTFARVQALLGGGSSVVYGVVPKSLSGLLWQLERMDGGVQARIDGVIDKYAGAHPTVYTDGCRSELCRDVRYTVLEMSIKGYDALDRVLVQLSTYLHCVNDTLDQLIRTHLVPLEMFNAKHRLFLSPGLNKTGHRCDTWDIRRWYCDGAKPFMYERSDALFAALCKAAALNRSATVALFERAENSFGGRILLKGMAAQLSESRYDPHVVGCMLPTFEAALRAVV